MIKKIIDTFKHFDKKTSKIMRYGLQFCFVLCIVSVFILFTYNVTFHSPFMYYIGISLFKLSLTFAIEFVVCGLVVDGIKKQMV